MTSSECAGPDVSESATVTQNRETAREVSGWEPQQYNDTANIYTFLE